MKNIALTGFMATGKSVVGKKVADILSFGYIDTDCLIEKICGMKIPEIFDKYGEKYFRGIEKVAVKRASRLKNHVISTGGGVVLNPSNIVQLRKHGVVICLKARPEIILRNVGDAGSRPILMSDDVYGRIKMLLDERQHFYEFADYTIDISEMGIDDAAAAVIKAYSILKTR
ncbi:shikimate kinase [Thermoanaerobacterium thermosaccharolyticum]|uniref:Shikimate kinase n=1 Tax=Thermoanaerobacterium thermosaccharolyticum TaxID=1517 RepID=A0A231VJ06_THETR|nr:shikimate kinase [Thermoanaerobacterium thermosaccharolyticum]AST59156.1 shikimate kinase [Thermoanaerobacterium thermosaccharolyticum]MBE0067730.1 shikimate kinase [Thermoanaerobacterium thermosaccharolyticum]MBE0227296.1 shikimate kinase [Thermoanaerobacterium thermosaccharolyticum]OXT07656.1 shikimate kinase [Thermoanaerobacterium thermosaccharolyticum]